MTLSLWQLFAIGLIYLSALSLVAQATEKGWIPARIVHHRLTHVLSLGAFACSISILGSMHLAYDFGGAFLLYFLAASAPFILAPLIMRPLRRITELHKLSSLADVFAFRFPGALTGGIVALSLLLGSLPLIALQIQAVAVTAHVLNQELTEELLAALYCAMIALFAVLFATRHILLREQNKGLVMALAVESLVKIVAVVAIALFALTTVVAEVEDVGIWMATQQPVRTRIGELLTDGQSRSLLLIFFAGAIAMPHSFHVAFSETSESDALPTARWGFPLYLLILSLAIPPILWAGLILGVPTDPEYFTLGIGIARDNPIMVVVAVLATLSATSGMLILITSALASMTLNHVLLPVLGSPTSMLYSGLLNLRRVLIAAIILAGFTLYSMLAVSQNLISLAIVAFVAVAQFLPGLAAALLWPRATRAGFLTGLCVGMLIWFVTLMVPLVINIFANLRLATGPLGYDISEAAWHVAIQLSLGANTLLLVVVSLLTRPTIEEEEAAYECVAEATRVVQRRALEAGSVAEIRQQLAAAVGRSVSDRELDSALAELRIDGDDQRPYTLQRLRARVEQSLSSVLGQTVARNIMGSFLPYKEERGGPMTPHEIEARIEEYQVQLTGLAKELDALRRYHRQTLQELPTAVCSLNGNGEILSWNDAMSGLTGLSGEQIIGFPITAVDQPWHSLLTDFARDNAAHVLKRKVDARGRTYWLNLHKALMDASVAQQEHLVIVIDDITENQILENKLLHSERLASIGQLAASVAHEIGNPVTGIACLTQNLKLESDNDEIREVSDQILDQTERISAIVQSLVNFAHSGQAQPGERYPVQLRKVVADAIQLLRLNPRNEQFVFTNRCGEELYTLGDAQRLVQVFINVLSNARDASPAGDPVVVESRVEGERAIVEVVDRGSGIPPERIGSVFEPFFTTKEMGQGTGLGLTIVYSIIEEHNGTIDVESPAGLNEQRQPVGTRLTIALPLYDHAGATGLPAAAAERAAPGTISVRMATPDRQEG